LLAASLLLEAPAAGCAAGAATASSFAWEALTASATEGPFSPLAAAASCEGEGAVGKLAAAGEGVGDGTGGRETLDAGDGAAGLDPGTLHQHSTCGHMPQPNMQSNANNSAATSWGASLEACSSAVKGRGADGVVGRSWAWLKVETLATLNPAMATCVLDFPLKVCVKHKQSFLCIVCRSVLSGASYAWTAATAVRLSLRCP
jgi:hypothetical protein